VKNESLRVRLSRMKKEAKGGEGKGWKINTKYIRLFLDWSRGTRVKGKGHVSLKEKGVVRGGGHFMYKGEDED